MNWTQIVFRRDIVVRSLKVGAVVGSLLCMINNGDYILTQQFEKISIFKVLLTYCVPYGVSTYASVSAILNLLKG